MDSAEGSGNGVVGSGESGASTIAARKKLASLERRVLGVLVEKAKTVPDTYPMTLNGIVNGCNQKSNRSPQMTAEEHQVETAIESLRRLGAVVEIHGNGRVPKFKHFAYEWLGVDKFELAVMTELMLRGEQTLGDLRVRASRMEPISDLAALQAIVNRLLEKGLMQELTPPGRGQMVTHNLYTDSEQARLATRTFAVAPEASEGTEGSREASRGRDEELESMRQMIRDLEARVANLEAKLE